jgi:hypothetical protein
MRNAALYLEKTSNHQGVPMLRVFIAVTAVAAMSGCATVVQKPIEMAPAVLSANAGRVGVAVAALPKVDTTFPGAGCLLCLAVASAANSALTDHTRTLPYEDLPELKKQIAAAVSAKGATPVVIEGDFKIADLPAFSGAAEGFAQRDFRPLAAKHSIDRLIYVQLNVVGIWRNYASYVPTGDPFATVKGMAYMVDLKTNALQWYAPIDITKGAAKWDQPPKYPDLTNAYYQAVELTKDAVLKPLQK